MDMALGAHALAEFAEVVAPQYPANIALHTDHCPADRVDGFIRPLLDLSATRRSSGQGPLFQSHMLDASAIPMEENLAIADELLDLCAGLDIILELEIGIVGGVEDAANHEDVDRSKLYTSPEDMVRRLGVAEGQLAEAEALYDHVVVNDDLVDTIAAVLDILKEPLEQP